MTANKERGTIKFLDPEIPTTDDPETAEDEGNTTVSDIFGDPALFTLLGVIAGEINEGDDPSPGVDDIDVQAALTAIGVYTGGTYINTAVLGDVVALGGGNDQMWAGSGNDIILGQGGNDVIRGEAGNDALYGGEGNDVLEGGEDADYLDGGTGNDTASYASSTDVEADGSGVTVNLSDGTGSGDDAEGDILTSIENLVGSDHNDTLTGDAGANVIDGGAGADIIVGGAGGDTLFGGNGGDNDTINVGFFPGDDESFGIDGRDGVVDTIVAAESFAQNGTDTVLNYHESENPAVDVDDVFDFSDAFDFDDTATGDEAAELDAFLTFDQSTGEIRSTGNPSEVWFDISELETNNEPEQVTVLVDGQMFLNEGSNWVEVA